MWSNLLGLLGRRLIKFGLSFLFGIVITAAITYLFKTYDKTIKENVELKFQIKERDQEIAELKRRIEDLESKKNKVIVKYKTKVVKEKEKCEEIVKILKREKPKKSDPPSNDPVLRDLNRLWSEN